MEINSRGDFEERLRAVTEALHQEIHLIEAMQKEPEKVEELTPVIDNLRKDRQELVKLTFGLNINPSFWCNLKHSLTRVRHLEEVLQNAARSNPIQVPMINGLLKQAIQDRDKAVKLFKSGSSNPKSGCIRCVNDLILPKENSQALNSSSIVSINEVKAKASDNSQRGDFSMVSTQQLTMVAGGIAAGRVLREVVPKLPFVKDQSANIQMGVKATLGVGLLALSHDNVLRQQIPSNAKMVLAAAGSEIVVEELVNLIVARFLGGTAFHNRRTIMPMMATQAPLVTPLRRPEEKIALF